MALHTPVWLQPSPGDAALAFTAQEVRQYNRAVLTAASGIGGQQGVVAASGFAVTQRGAGANLSVDVGSGLAFILGDDITNQGTYEEWNDATVNVPTPNPPASGTEVHRLVLQIQDKLSNGVWTGYQAALTVLADTGSGTPAEPNSAITLALISISSVQTSVQNAQITDYRQRVGPVNVFKTADEGRAGTTTLADDGPTGGSLSLLNLPANSWLKFSAAVIFAGGSGASEGDLAWKFRTGGLTSMRYYHGNPNLSGNFGTTVANSSDTGTAGTTGVSNDLPLTMTGFIQTGNAPCYAVLQWAQNSNTGTNTWIRAGSRMSAEPGQ